MANTYAVNIKELKSPCNYTESRHGVKELQLEKLTFGFIREIEQEISGPSTNISNEKSGNLLIDAVREVTQNAMKQTNFIIPEEVMRMCMEYAIEVFHTYFTIYDDIHSSINTVSINNDSPGSKYSKYQILKGTEKVDGTADVVYLSTTQFDKDIHDVTLKCIKSHPNDKSLLIAIYQYKFIVFN